MSKDRISLPYNFQPRSYQIPVWERLEDGCKRVVWVCHRRAGKDLTLWNWTIQQVLNHKQIAFYILPTYSQAKKVIWDGMTKDGIKFLEFIPKELITRRSEQELSLHLYNGSVLQLIGSDNYDRLMGTNPRLCVFSEYSLQNPKAWEYIRPILAENKGTAIFNFTPRGKNHAYDLFEMARNNPSWFCEKLTIDETKVLTTQDMDRERKEGMSDDLIQQEFYCSFELGVEGSYYSKYIETMKQDKRIGNVPWDKQARVNTVWDLGIGDSTSIIFYQNIGNEIHVIDYYETSGEGLAHYAEVLKNKPYIYEDHFAPHDIENRELGTGLSRKTIAMQLGINFATLPTLKMRLADGIETVRGIFPRLWIDAVKCSYLIKCLENYKKEFDDKQNVYKLRPVHNWASHGADAFRYMAIALRHYNEGTEGYSDREATKMYEEAMPLFR